MNNFYKKLEIFIDEMEDKKNEIPILNFILSEQGKITNEILKFVSEKTGIWDVSLKNTVNFYPKYKMEVKKVDKIEIIYCNGRNCNERNEKIISELMKIDNIEEKVIISTKYCFGNCKNGPSMKIDGLLYDKTTLEKIKRVLKI